MASRLFHITVHALAKVAEEGGPPAHLGGIDVETHRVDAQVALPSLAATFDQVRDALVNQPGMYFEPDGSLVWVGQEGGERWQLDGQLIDEGERLRCVELKGRCTDDAWSLLVRTLGAESRPLLIQLLPEGVFLDEPQFRRWAGLS
jgi:hypothetical protein